MNNSVCTKELSQILHFWHKVEFFIPFDLQRQVLEAEDAEWAVNSWSIESLRRADRSLWSPPVPSECRLTGFDVYLVIFDKSLLAEITQRVLHESSHPNEIGRPIANRTRVHCTDQVDRSLGVRIALARRTRSCASSCFGPGSGRSGEPSEPGSALWILHTSCRRTAWLYTGMLTNLASGPLIGFPRVRFITQWIGRPAGCDFREIPLPVASLTSRVPKTQPEENCPRRMLFHC